MGDLVVGARSGSGEPEKGEAAVPPVPPVDSNPEPRAAADAAPPGQVIGSRQGEEDGRGGNVGHGGDVGNAGGTANGGGIGNVGGAGGIGSAGISANGSHPVHGSHVEDVGPGGPVPGYEPGPGPGAHGIPGDPGQHGDGRPADPAGPGGPKGPGDGEPSGSRPAPTPGRKQQRSFWKELPLLIGIALVLALLIKTFLVQAFSIPSDSMQNTLQQGDRVLVDKLTPWFGSTPSRGEVVVFHDPGGWLPENPPASSNPLVRGLQKGLSFIGLMPSADEKDLIKRVIGVGGDTVECKGTGPLKVNGKALNEPYVFPGNTPCTADTPFKITVPKGRIWVMGDHRQDSLDSRYHMQLPGGGTVADGDVVGRAVVVAWPVNRWAALSIPGTFSQPGISAAGAAAPAAAGLAGAAPLVLLRRRRLLNRADVLSQASAVTATGAAGGAGAGGTAVPAGGTTNAEAEG